MIKLRFFKGEDFSRLSRSAQCNHKDSFKREEGGSELITEKVKTEAKD